MLPQLLTALSSESGEGFTHYVLILAPLAAVVALVVLTVIMSPS